MNPDVFSVKAPEVSGLTVSERGEENVTHQHQNFRVSGLTVSERGQGHSRICQYSSEVSGLTVSERGS